MSNYWSSTGYYHHGGRFWHLLTSGSPAAPLLTKLFFLSPICYTIDCIRKLSGMYVSFWKKPFGYFFWRVSGCSGRDWVSRLFRGLSLTVLRLTNSSDAFEMFLYGAGDGVARFTSSISLGRTTIDIFVVFWSKMGCNNIGQVACIPRKSSSSMKPWQQQQSPGYYLAVEAFSSLK